jgi:hypothetical protein
MPRVVCCETASASRPRWNSWRSAKASDEALKVPVLTMAVQADEFRELRARAIAAGNVPDVAQHRLKCSRIFSKAGWKI